MTKNYRGKPTENHFVHAGSFRHLRCHLPPGGRLSVRLAFGYKVFVFLFPLEAGEHSSPLRAKGGRFATEFLFFFTP